MSVSSRRPSRLRWVWVGLAVVAILLLVVYGAMSYLVYDGLAAARPCEAQYAANTPAAYTVPAGVDASLPARYEMPAFADVRFPSRDGSVPGLQLAGWWVPSAQVDAPAVVVVHGIWSCRKESSVLLAAGMLADAGFSVLVMDLRDSGDSGSEDGRFAAGSDEYLDVLGGWDWVRAQGVPADRIGLLGMSLGSLSSLIAGGQEPLVAAVWADSAATRMDEALGNFVVVQLGDPTGLSRVLVPGALLWARATAGDDLVEYDLVEQVSRYGGRHVAFVHGSNDTTLPAAWSTQLHDAAVAAGATTPAAWIVPGAAHNKEVYVDADGYWMRLVKFFDDALGAP
jgi:dienelactone hydrolase